MQLGKPFMGDYVEEFLESENVCSSKYIYLVGKCFQIFILVNLLIHLLVPYMLKTHLGIYIYTLHHLSFPHLHTHFINNVSIDWKI